MIKVNFIKLDGSTEEVEAAEGSSLMKAAVDNGIEDVSADCGGACACATCHVHIDPQWLDKVGPANEHEVDMLSLEDEANEFSRLSCQVTLQQELDGVVVKVAER